MGKHVPSGNLFPTVRSRRPTGQRVYLSTERVRLPTYRSNDDRPLDRTSLDACTVLLRLDDPFWWILSYVCCEERNRLILRLVLCTGCDERPRLILSCMSFENEITRTSPRQQLCRYAYSPADRTIVPLRLRSTDFAGTVLPPTFW